MPASTHTATKSTQSRLMIGLALMLAALVLGIVFIRQSQDPRQQAMVLPRAGVCTEQCPGSDGVLRSCTPPESDGSSNDSTCNQRGRVEICGNRPYCCPSAGGTWTTNMSACPSPTPTRAPSPTVTRAPSPTVTRTPSPTPTNAPTATPTRTPTPTVTGAPSPTTTPSVQPSPTTNPSVNPSPTVSPNPSLSPTASVNPTATNKRGDFNDDGLVNNEDVGMLLNVYGRSVSLLPEADLNNDGKINAIDYAIIIDLLGT